MKNHNLSKKEKYTDYICIQYDIKKILCKKKVIVIFPCLLIIFVLLIHLTQSNKDHKSLIDKYNKYTGNGVCIAIIDSGINKKNASTVSKNINFTELDNEYDQNGHGTYMYKIIHGNMGIAKNAKIYMLKVADKDCKASSRNIVNAVNWCIDNDVQIISMSLSTSKNSTQLHDAIIKAYKKGIRIFASVANDSCFQSYPASYNEVIGVYSWRKKDSYNSYDYLYCPINEFYIDSNNKINGNSPATAFMAGLASHLLEKGHSNRKAISKNELVKELKLYLNE